MNADNSEVGDSGIADNKILQALFILLFHFFLKGNGVDEGNFHFFMLILFPFYLRIP